MVEDVRAEPWLAGRRLALKGEAPLLADSGRRRDEPRGLEQLRLVRVAEREDPLRQRVGGEDDVRAALDEGGAADAAGEQVDEAGLFVPALDEPQLGAAGDRTLELVAVALDRHDGVVRREHEPDEHVGAARERRLGRLDDPRRPVLHARQDGDAELDLERRARGLGDRVQRRAVLDPEPPVALDEIGEVLRRDRPPAADVGVVGGNVGEPLGRAVRHQDDRSAHYVRTVAEAPASARGGRRRSPAARPDPPHGRAAPDAAGAATSSGAKTSESRASEPTARSVGFSASPALIGRDGSDQLTQAQPTTAETDRDEEEAGRPAPPVSRTSTPAARATATPRSTCRSRKGARTRAGSSRRRGEKCSVERQDAARRRVARSPRDIHQTRHGSSPVRGRRREQSGIQERRRASRDRRSPRRRARRKQLALRVSSRASRRAGYPQARAPRSPG